MDVRKVAPRIFELSCNWSDVKLLMDWNQIVNAHSLGGAKGICIHWQAKPKSEVSIASVGFGKSETPKFGRSWGVYVVHEDLYLTPPDAGNSNKGIQIPEFVCESCSCIDVPEEFNSKVPVAVVWFPRLTATMKNKNIIIEKIKQNR